MATFDIYSYKISPNVKEETLEDLLKSSLNIVIKTKGKDVYTFLYDSENNLLHLSFHNPVTPSDLIKIFSSGSSHKDDVEIVLESSTPHNQQGILCSSIKKIKDFPRMISDLEARSIVKIEKTNSAMAVDERKFYFSGENTKYDVDCLGTTLCRDISDRVIDEWRKLKC